MRVEIVEEAEGQAPSSVWPPEENYVDLRANPEAIEGIAAARQYLPIGNFLASVNGPESIFATASVAVKTDAPAAVSAGLAHEFASETRIVFADPPLNWEKKPYAELGASLKELLDRDTGEATRAVLRISSCDFKELNRRGYCLSIRLVAEGASAQQAELRCGLALARVQQALLFRSRAMKHQIVG